MKGHPINFKLSKHKERLAKTVNMVSQMIDDDYIIRRAPNNYIGTDEDLKKAKHYLEIYRANITRDK